MRPRIQGVNTSRQTDDQGLSKFVLDNTDIWIDPGTSQFREKHTEAERHQGDYTNHDAGQESLSMSPRLCHESRTRWTPGVNQTNALTCLAATLASGKQLLPPPWSDKQASRQLEQITHYKRVFVSQHPAPNCIFCASRMSQIPVRTST